MKTIFFSLYPMNAFRNFLMVPGSVFDEVREAPGVRVVLLIAPGTGENRVKLWGRDKFAALADHLHRKHRAIVAIIGGAGDAREAEEMVSFLNPATPFINTCGRFTIDELKAFIARLSLFISVDTGPIYIAEAFRVPTIDIVGPVDEREQPPRGKRHVAVVPPSRTRAELYVMNSRAHDAAEARRQSDAISAEAVIAAADELIGRLQRGGRGRARAGTR